MPPRKRARADAAAASSAPLVALKTSHDVDNPQLQAEAAMWRAGELCDLTVTVDGSAFAVHKLKLAAASDYFRALLPGDRFADSAEHQLKDMKASVFEGVLSFIYEGSCNVPEELLVPLLEAASRLQVAPLAEALTAALKERISVANALSTWIFADRASLPELAATARQHTLKHFADVAATDDFVQLSHEMLSALLASDEVEADEAAVFTALVRWLRAQAPAVREESTVAALLEHVRFSTMSADFLTEHVETEPLMNTAAAFKVLAQAMKEKSFGAATPRTTPRTGGPLNPKWVLEGHDAANVSAAGETMTTQKGLVRVDTLIASGTYEVVFKLTEDGADLSAAVSGFGIVRDNCDRLESNSNGMPNVWWLRRFHRMVYSENHKEGLTPHGYEFPIGAEARMLVDMAAGQVTFFIDGVEVPHKAKGITGPVYPCALSYGRKVSVSIVSVRRLKL
mmetsp:Transcript_40130/g.132797  ORF Transcript_40130/g.132797 Transcript_40130/m.132797 type:complete len:454 (-) Transcript_40130:1357-2718(-)